MARTLTIILRTCGKVFSQHGGRYVNKPKSEIINVCVSSLVNSINQVQDHNVMLYVLDDHSDDPCVASIKKIISHCKFPVTFTSIEDGTGNGHTMSKVYEHVEKYATDLWYHVEDDYLHYPEAIQDMLDTVDEFESATGKMIAINPHDDIWRYRSNIYPSFLLLGPYRHYRTVKHTTYTCLASKAIYDKYRNHFQDVVTLTNQRSDWVEDKSINKVWNKEDLALFSPIPSLALHLMDESGKDPYIDFDQLWDSVPKLWNDAQRPSVAIVSLFNEKHQDLANETWTNKQAYAKKHGYLAVAKTDNFSKEQVHFDKFVHILDVMNSNPNIEWVWWLDNDAMITNFDIRVEDLVDLDYHVVMGVDIAALNTGSFLVRNSLQAKNWLEFLLSKKEHYKNDTKWYEQQAVIDFYPKFQNLFKLIPQRLINSYDYNMYGVDGIDLLGYDGQWTEDHFVIHWPGLQNDLRINLARQYKQYIKDTR